MWHLVTLGGVSWVEVKMVRVREGLKLDMGIIAACTEKVTRLRIGIRYRCLMCRHELTFGRRSCSVRVVIGRNRVGLLSRAVPICYCGLRVVTELNVPIAGVVNRS